MGTGIDWFCPGKMRFRSLGLEFGHWEWDKHFVTVTTRDITHFLGSRNVRKCFKRLVRVNFEHVYPDPACAGLVTICRLKNEN